MRLLALTVTVLVIATMVSGQGFLDSLRNFFRPPRQAARPRPQQQVNPGQVQFQQPLQQQQRPQRQTSFRNNFGVQPQGRPLTSSNGVRTQGFRTNTNNVQASVSTRAKPQCGLPAEDPNDRESPRCPSLGSSENYDGKRIVYTWDHPNCKQFTATQADNYCKSLGGRPVSLDSNARSDYFLKKAADFGQRYYWTGGRLDHNCKVLTWPSGKQEGWIEGQRYWSPIGGWNNTGIPRPQPDNRNEYRDHQEPESCLAILNNFYADGIKWHDVACHHKKPTICEI